MGLANRFALSVAGYLQALLVQGGICELNVVDILLCRREKIWIGRDRDRLIILILTWSTEVR